MRQATMPEYYERNSSSVALINGGTGNDLLVVDGMLVQGKTTRTYGRGGSGGRRYLSDRQCGNSGRKAYIGGSEVATPWRPEAF